MKIHFYSFSDGEKIDFISECSYENNTYFFKDQTDLGTTISFKVLDEHRIEFKRSGHTITTIIFDKFNITKAFYDNNEGLAFNFNVKTNRLDLEINKIVVEYDLILDGEIQSSIKIYLLIK